jgi:putative DNA primase/helicase
MANAQTIPLSDQYNAEALVQFHGADLRYCLDWHEWLYWTGHHWARQGTGEAMRRAKRTVKRLARLIEQMDDAVEIKAHLSHIKSSLSARRLEGMVRLAQSEPTIELTADQLDPNPWLLNCPNGTLNLRNATLKDHDRGDLITKCIPVPYDPDATCPRWEQFLHEIFANDAELIDFIQKAVGYSLTGDVSEQCLFFPYGGGNNGKTTFLNTIHALLGPDYAAQAMPELLLTRQFEPHPTERMDLYSRRFVATVEVEDGKRMAESLVKLLTGNERIRARRMRENTVEFAPTHKLWLAANHKPDIRGRDRGIWRRIRLIPFNIDFTGREDKGLSEKLTYELPGILCWGLRGCLRWQTNGMEPPDAIKKATESYQAEMDMVSDFITDYCVKIPQAKTRVGELYATYKRWCEENHETPVNHRRFGDEMVNHGFPRDTGHGNARFHKGIGLIKPSETEANG